MKKTNIYFNISCFALLTVLLFTGCKKNAINYSDFEYVSDDKARIKINYNVAFKANPFVQIKINGVRVSGLNIKTRYPFPGGGFNTEGGSTGDYLPIDPGNTEVSISIPKKGTNIDSVPIFKGNIATAAGKYYSLHVADTTNVKSFGVEEDLTLPDSGFVRMRFVNLMPNVPALDLYVGTLKVASNIAYMGISENFTLPTSQATINTTWAIRPAGAAATSTALATYNSASTLLSRRVYTAFASGYSNVGTATTELRRPYVAFYFVK